MVKFLGRDFNLPDFEGAFAGLTQRMEGFTGSAPQFETFDPRTGERGGFNPRGGQFQSRFQPQTQFTGGFRPGTRFQGGFRPSGGFQGGFSPSGGFDSGFMPAGPQFTPFQPSGVGKRTDPVTGQPLGDEIFGPPGSPGNPGTSAPGTGKTGVDSATDQWRDYIDEAVEDTEVDGDFVQALMMFESEGQPGATSGAGAIGLMQVMPGEFQPGESPYDPRTNIRVGVRVILAKIKAVRATYARLGINRTGRDFWGDVGAAYLGGFDYDTGQRLSDPSTADMYGTTGAKYADVILGNYDKIKGARAAQAPPPGTGGQGTPPSQRMVGIWGDPNAPISQEHGTTPYATKNPGVYSDYAPCMGMTTGQHPGLDILLKVGTTLRMPAGMSGTVVSCGGTGFYNDTMGQGAGELRVRLANGHEIIFGHVSTIAVPCGATVSGGQVIATSGGSEGPHLHLEYRVPDSSMACGQRIVDPRQFI